MCTTCNGKSSEMLERICILIESSKEYNRDVFEVEEVMRMNGCGWVVLEEGGGGVNRAKNWLQRPVMALTVLPSEWSMSTVKYYTNTNRLLLTGMLWLWFGRFGKNGSTRIRQ